tara:strand:+ start:325 stop:567 length:243 start_codon:yes stop_codon:yes gene_type:complete
LAGLDKLFDEPIELIGLLYILGLTLAELLILSIRDNLSLRLVELDLLNLFLILVSEKLSFLDEIRFLEPLLPLTKAIFEL